MKAVVVAFVSVLVLAACGSSNNDKKGGGTVQQEEARPVTTRAQCVGGRPATSLTGSWTTEFQAGAFAIHARFTFDGQMLRMENTCEMGGNAAVASVSAPYTATSYSIRTLANAQSERTRNGITCNAAIATGEMQYRIEGGCLVLSDNSGSVLYLQSAY